MHCSNRRQGRRQSSAVRYGPLQRTIVYKKMGKAVRGRHERHEVSLKSTRSDIGRKARSASNLDVTAFALT